MIKTASLAIVIAALGIGCGKNHAASAVGPAWHKLGFPIDPDHITIDPENPNDDNTMIVIYPDDTSAQPAFDQYRTALIKAGYVVKDSSHTPDESSWSATLTKDGRDLYLHVSHSSDGADVMVKRRK